MEVHFISTDLSLLVSSVIFFCLFDHSLGFEDLASEPRKVVELIEYWDYPSETHWVTTADGYILTVHRIPPRNTYNFNQAWIE